MVALIKAAQLILSLSILVVLHELGHFAPAKWFKTRVEKFYLFFDPGFSLFKVKRGETEYGIGWLPLGGYVKIAGMVDESMDTEALKEEPKPWEFRSKPAWQRLIIMIGGVTVNLILGFFIYAMVFFVWGEDYLKVEDVPYGLHFEDRIEFLGFQEGDNIVALNGAPTIEYDDIRRSIFSETVTNVTVDRNGQEIVLEMPEDLGQIFIDSNVRQPFLLRFPTIIDSLVADGGAIKGGLQQADQIVGINDMRGSYFQEIATEINKNINKEIDVHVIRDGIETTVTCMTDTNGTIGFLPLTPNNLKDFNYQHRSFSFGSAIPAGFVEAKEILEGYVLSLRFLFSKSGATQIGSFITLGSIFDASWNWQIFWRTTAFLSLILAFMNLLPIPALDGGHVAFLLYEMVAGKPAPQKFLERAQMVGVIILLGLMVFAIGNDIYRWLTDAL
ncbi:MAG: RIP metalloprotease RseP [Flavobacteriales bacterium]|nr:RIP metalloprotease RseP [Flavobacteriales bacterium]